MLTKCFWNSKFNVDVDVDSTECWCPRQQHADLIIDQVEYKSICWTFHRCCIAFDKIYDCWQSAVLVYQTLHFRLTAHMWKNILHIYLLFWNTTDIEGFTSSRSARCRMLQSLYGRWLLDDNNSKWLSYRDYILNIRVLMSSVSDIRSSDWW